MNVQAELSEDHNECILNISNDLQMVSRFKLSIYNIINQPEDEIDEIKISIINNDKAKIFLCFLSFYNERADSTNQIKIFEKEYVSLENGASCEIITIQGNIWSFDDLDNIYYLLYLIKQLLEKGIEENE